MHSKEEFYTALLISYMLPCLKRKIQTDLQHCDTTFTFGSVTHNAGKFTRFLLHYLLFLQTWTETARFLYLVILILLEVCHSSTETALHSQSVTPGAIPLLPATGDEQGSCAGCSSFPQATTSPPPPPPPPLAGRAGSTVLLHAPSQSKTRASVTPVNGQGRQSPLTGGRHSGCLPPLVSFLWVQQTRGFFSEGSTNRVRGGVQHSPLLAVCHSNNRSHTLRLSLGGGDNISPRRPCRKFQGNFTKTPFWATNTIWITQAGSFLESAANHDWFATKMTLITVSSVNGWVRQHGSAWKPRATVTQKLDLIKNLK